MHVAADQAGPQAGLVASLKHLLEARAAVTVEHLLHLPAIGPVSHERRDRVPLSRHY